MAQRASGFDRIASDEYMTPKWVVMVLLGKLNLHGMFWDPACGTGNIVQAITEIVRKPDSVFGTDINPEYDGNYGNDFIKSGASTHSDRPVHIITNPPYGQRGWLAEDFISTALQITAMCGGTVSMLLPIDFDSAKGRFDIFGGCEPFDAKIVLLKRIRWTNIEQSKSSPSQNHAWFHWDHNRRPGLPVIDYAGRDA